MHYRLSQTKLWQTKRERNSLGELAKQGCSTAATAAGPHLPCCELRVQIKHRLSKSFFDAKRFVRFLQEESADSYLALSLVPPAEFWGFWSFFSPHDSRPAGNRQGTPVSKGEKYVWTAVNRAGSLKEP